MPALPPELPIVDHHCHLAPGGEGVRAVARFRAAGGTHLFLATQNYSGRPPTHPDDYREQFATTVRLAREAEAATGVVVYPVLAPYPVDLVAAVERLGRPAAVELHAAALDLAAHHVREREAVALGEVGRPHFPVPTDVVEAANEVLSRAFSAAKDADCPAVVHTADLDAAGYAELADRAREVGLPPHRVVKHYARAPRPDGVGTGPVPSYLARRDLVRDVIASAAPWFLETDFLDDPARPGAVLDLATVPRRAAALAAQDPAQVERLRVPFVDSVRHVYGWAPEVGGRFAR